MAELPFDPLLHTPQSVDVRDTGGLEEIGVGVAFAHVDSRHTHARARECLDPERAEVSERAGHDSHLPAEVSAHRTSRRGPPPSARARPPRGARTSAPCPRPPDGDAYVRRIARARTGG